MCWLETGSSPETKREGGRERHGGGEGGSSEGGREGEREGGRERGRVRQVIQCTRSMLFYVALMCLGICMYMA